MDDSFPPVKKLGQNFLQSKAVILNMIDALDVQEGETIVEIGPGLGAITLELMNKIGTEDVQVLAVEIDLRFADKLKNMFWDRKNFEIIDTNVLDWLPTFDAKDQPYKIIGSLPYYITTPILNETVRLSPLPEVCVLVVQKEVAQKVSAKAPDSTNISVLLQTFFEVDFLQTIDKKDFSPEPAVDGGLIKLTKRVEASYGRIEDMDKYIRFLNRAFATPRKMLNKVFSQDELNRAEIDGSLRPQNYNWEKWAKIFTVTKSPYTT